MRRTLAAALVAFAVLAVLSLDKRGLPGLLYADEATYYGMASSLAHDGDLRFETEDRLRLEQGWRSAASGVIVMGGEDGRMRFSKPLLYPLLGAAPARLFGANGLLLVNLFGLSLALLAVTVQLYTVGGKLELSAFAAATLLLATAAPTYLSWMMPTCLSMGLVAAGLALAWSPLEPGADQRLPLLGGSLAPLLGGVLLGAAGTLRYAQLLLLLAPLVGSLARRRWRHLLLVLLGAALGLGLLLGLTRLLAGHWDPYTAERWSYTRGTDGWPPLAVPDPLPPGVGRSWQPEQWPGLSRPTLAAWSGVDWVLGRHTGLLLYFAPALLALVVGLRGRRWSLLAAVLAVQAFFLLKLPHNYFGGSSFVGNRYLSAWLPAFAFLWPRPPSGRSLVGLWAWAGLGVSVLMLSPLRPVGRDDSTQARAHAGLFRLAPYETSAERMDGQQQRRWAGLEVVSVDPYAQLGEARLKLRNGDPPAELIVRSPEPLAGLVFRYRSVTASGELRVADWANRKQESWDTEPRELRIFDFKLSRTLRVHPSVSSDGALYHYAVRLGFRSQELVAQDWPLELELMGGRWVLDPELARAELLDAVSWHELGHNPRSARCDLRSQPARCLATASTALRLKLRNPTPRLWYHQGGGAVELGYRWSRGGELVAEGRGPLQVTVGPGETIWASLPLELPAEPGSYRLEAGLLWEGLRWFSNPEGEPLLTREVEVLDADSWRSLVAERSGGGS